MSNVTQLYVLHKSRSLMRSGTSLVQDFPVGPTETLYVVADVAYCIHLTYNKTSSQFFIEFESSESD